MVASPLKAIRKQYGVTTTELSHRTGFSAYQLSLIEMGFRKPTKEEWQTIFMGLEKARVEKEVTA